MNSTRSSRLLNRLKTPGKALHVIGLGHFGGNLALIQYLAEQGHPIVLWEQGKASLLEKSWKKLSKHHHLITAHWEEPNPKLPHDDWVFVTPAISWQHPALAKVSYDYLSTEIEISLTLAEQNKIKIHTVLGSVGKSTCTALIQNALHIPMVGNIGCSLLSLLNENPKEVVLELSSFQLHYLKPTDWEPSSFLLTPVDDHHADWHGSLEAYQNAKLNWVHHWDSAGIPNIQFRNLNFDHDLLNGKEPNLIGRHNLKNIHAVLSWLNVLKRSSASTTNACLNFKGLPHRLELCFQSETLKCYNDSKATSPSATLEALHSFKKIDLLILQGNLKDLDYSKLLKKAQEKCEMIWFVGGISELNKNQEVNFKDLDEAFQSGHLPKAGNILFSPATPSYGYYQNYEERGEHFKKLTRLLK